MKIHHVVINDVQGKARVCSLRNCYNFVFVKDGDHLVCRKCGTENVLAPGIESIGVFPREGRELIDAFNILPRFSFWRGESSVKRVPDYSGAWIEQDGDDVRELLEETQHTLNDLRAKLKQYETNGE